ncbi:glycosyl transferase family group 2-domain-containing protein, partial [Entophlyctis helioformis]
GRRSPPSCRTREILTVMDADTAFAQDYFSCIAYHYTVASAEQRKIMMFAPSTVFDRNANDVPIFVRMADMVWSAGVLANLYPTSPIKVPCSAYSLSMDLAVAVGFWDTDPTSIGEDMHMYLKCFYATEGRVIVNPIYSPASQCNIQGDSWFETFKQRYTQSKRHMWGSLDAGYIIRRALFAFFAPGYDAPGGQLQEVPLIRPAATRGSQEIQMSLSKVAHLFHRIFEANMILGQVFVLIFITSLILPVENSPSPFAESYWSLITTEAVHPYVAAAASLGGYIRMVATVPFLTMIFFYEKYVFWVGTERWIWSLREQVRPGSGLRVQPLGKRSQLASTRSIFNLIDWVALPVCGLIYLAMPQIHAQCLQLFTDRLDYAVASKPAVAGKTLPASSAPESETLMTRDSDLTTVTVHAASPSAGSTSAAAAAAHNLRPSISNSSSLSAESDKSAASSRGDSGFFEFDDSSIPAGAPVSPSMFSPSMWRQHTKARSTLSSEWSDADSNHELSPSASMDFALPPADAPAVMTL